MRSLAVVFEAFCSETIQEAVRLLAAVSGAFRL